MTKAKKADTEITSKVSDAVTLSVETAPTVKKTPARKSPAKTTSKKSPAKTAAKEVAATENVYIQFKEAEITSVELVERAKVESGIKSPKNINVYFKPEENMVYYVVDDNKGSFSIS